MSQPSPWLLQHLEQIHADAEVLDLASGCGRHCQPLLAKGCRVWAVDRDMHALQGIAPCQRLRRWVWDVETAGLPEALQVDVLLAFNYLHRGLFATLGRHLHRGGLLLHETFHIRNRQENGRPRREHFCWQQGEAERFFRQCGFRIVASEDGVASAGRWLTRIAAVRE